MTNLSWFLRFVCAATVLVLGGLLGVSAHGQYETATVLGFVHDTSGAVIPGAKANANQRCHGRRSDGNRRRARAIRIYERSRRTVSRSRRVAPGFSETLQSPSPLK